MADSSLEGKHLFIVEGEIRKLWDGRKYVTFGGDFLENLIPYPTEDAIIEPARPCLSYPSEEGALATFE